MNTPVVPGYRGQTYYAESYFENLPLHELADVETDPRRATWRDRLLLVGLMGIFAMAGLIIALPAFI